MMPVRPKKNLGQHFLHDENIARKIVDSLDLAGDTGLLEIGPGTGVLTKYLFSLQNPVKVMEIDREAYLYLLDRFPERQDSILHLDFLRADLNAVFGSPFTIIGNFPYNISSPIFFRILDHRAQITQVVCMIQKEVADRLRAGPGSRTYGILSVLLQAFYRIRYLFTVGPGVFSPPPKVHSAVIRLERNERRTLPCKEETFRNLVKAAFNQRRKTLRNSLKGQFPIDALDPDMLALRPEQLSAQQFIELAVSAEADKSV